MFYGVRQCRLLGHAVSSSGHRPITMDSLTVIPCKNRDKRTNLHHGGKPLYSGDLDAEDVQVAPGTKNSIARL